MLDNKKKLEACLVGLLKYIEIEFFSLFVLVFYMAVSKQMGTLGSVLFSVVNLAIIICIMLDYGLKLGAKAKSNVKLHGALPCKNFGLAPGLFAAIPAYFTFIICMLSKAGVVGNILPAYKIINSSFFALLHIFSPTAFATDLGVGAIIVMLVTPLLYPIAMLVGYKIGYNEVDVKRKLVYKD